MRTPEEAAREIVLATKNARAIAQELGCGEDEPEAMLEVATDLIRARDAEVRADECHQIAKHLTKMQEDRGAIFAHLIKIRAASHEGGSDA